MFISVVADFSFFSARWPSYWLERPI